jgi:hypothetical protein
MLIEILDLSRGSFNLKLIDLLPQSYSANQEFTGYSRALYLLFTVLGGYCIRDRECSAKGSVEAGRRFHFSGGS